MELTLRVVQILGACQYLNFIKIDTSYAISQTAFVFASEMYCEFLILQSSIHYEWSVKYGNSKGATFRYAPSKCFETFPFPSNLSSEQKTKLEVIGKAVHEHRQNIMLKIRLGLTKTYNQFHNKQLEVIDSALSQGEMEKAYGKEIVSLWKHLKKTENTCSFEEAVKDIYHLRELHKEMDNAVLQAYSWEDIDLAHDFYQDDSRTGSDHIRYTISPESRKEVLKRLLKLNHKIHEQEITEAKGLGKAKKIKKTAVNDAQIELGI